MTAVTSDRSRFPLNCLLYHGPEFPTALVHSVPGLRTRSAISFLASPDPGDEPSVFIADRSLLDQAAALHALPDHVVVISADQESDAALGDAADLSLAGVQDDGARLRVIRTAFQLSAARSTEARWLNAIANHHGEMVEMNRIGMALMMERDREAVLRQILTQVMRSTVSDAGALYLIEPDQAGAPRLRFKLIQVNTAERPLAYDDDFPVDSSSLAGHVAITRQPLVLDDIRKLPPDAPYSVNPFPEQHGYWIKSMLTIPMIDHLGEAIGVLQLANRKLDPLAPILNRDDAMQHVVPYTRRDVEFGFSLAGQAAILIENARLYSQIDDLFECFVKAAVTAIDQRDPTTAGHSLRVATLVTDLARAFERSPMGASRNLRFSKAQMRELHYAALLHDFGKVGVAEAVLVKAKKLPPVLLERVANRFDLIALSMQLHYERRRTQRMRDGESADQIDAELESELDCLERYKARILAANEPAPTTQETTRLLAEAASHTFMHPDGRMAHYLEPDELHYLRIPYGTLDEEERREIESHAQQTYEFLSSISWTDDLSEVPAYASSHHEKLDGSGYPKRLQADAIPIQTRILAVADIFDALTAADRPYKAAMSEARALDIIHGEVAAGKLDGDVLQVMIASGVHRRLLNEDWRRF